MILSTPPSRLFVNEGGRLSVDVISPRVISTVMSGRLDIKIAAHFLANLDAWVKLGASRLLAFHDWEGVDDYDSPARELLTPWSKTNRPRFEAVHILVSGRALAWGIKIVNGLTGDVMTPHFERAAFQEVRRAAVNSSRDVQ